MNNKFFTFVLITALCVSSLTASAGRILITTKEEREVVCYDTDAQKIVKTLIIGLKHFCMCFQHGNFLLTFTDFIGFALKATNSNESSKKAHL